MREIVDCEYSIEGDGPALFLVHGIGAARNTWRKAMPLLTKHFKVISYDLRGHGASPMPNGEFGLDDLVADLERLREITGIEKAHFAGHSLGGMIGPAYALRYPDRVLSLGLLSTAAFRTEDDSDKVWSVVRLMEQNGIEQVLANLTSRWFTDEFIKNNPGIITARLKQVIDTDSDVFMNVFRIYAGTEMSPWLSQVKTPSLILTGENDGGCNPRLNQQIHTALTNSELFILPDYKHSILLEAGEVVAERLIQFIASIR
jgi:3-oxoadipate enol-lactonase